jgi:uncharacterized membrane protein YjjP (DUF1212 family)
MPNQDNRQDLAAQHRYAREKEKADQILKRYDVIMKIVLGFMAGFFGPLILFLFSLGFTVIAVLILIASGAGAFFAYKAIKTKKQAHQAILDNQIMNNMQD